MLRALIVQCYTLVVWHTGVKCQMIDELLGSRYGIWNDDFIVFYEPSCLLGLVDWH